MNDFATTLQWDLEQLEAYLRFSGATEALVKGIDVLLIALVVVILLAARGGLRHPRRWLGGVVAGWSLGAVGMVALVEARRAAFVEVLFASPVDPSSPVMNLEPVLHHGSALRLSLLVMLIMTALAALAAALVIHRHRQAFAEGAGRLVIACGAILGVACLIALVDHQAQMAITHGALEASGRVDRGSHLAPAMAGPTWWPLMTTVGLALTAVLWRRHPGGGRPIPVALAAVVVGAGCFAATRSMAADARHLPPLPGVSATGQIKPAISLPERGACLSLRDTSLLTRTPEGQLQLDGQLEDPALPGLRRKVELWKSFHPHRAFPGVLAIDAPSETPVARMVPLLTGARSLGHHTVQMVYRAEETKLETKTLGTLERHRVCVAELHLVPEDAWPLTDVETWGRVLLRAHESGHVSVTLPP